MKPLKSISRVISLVVVMLLAGAAPSFAHAPKMGEHGGPQADAGSFHVEIVPKDTLLEVYLRANRRRN